MSFTFNEKANQVELKRKFIKLAYKKFATMNKVPLRSVIAMSKVDFLFSYNLAIKIIDDPSLKQTASARPNLTSQFAEGWG